MQGLKGCNLRPMCPAMSLPASASSAPAGHLASPRLLLFIAIACGLSAGANYINQPLIHSIAQALGVGDSRASYLVTVAQVSYAVGLLFLVPLGDVLDRRRLVAVLMTLGAGGLLLSAASPWTPRPFAVLVAGTLMTGLFSVAAQVLVPFASQLVPPAQSGRAVGLVMSGLLIGILAARTVAGLLSDLGGWNTAYWVAGLAMFGMACVLYRALPPRAKASAARLPYGQVLRSMVALVRSQPRLRTRTLLGALAFGATSVLFSTMALLLAGPGLGYGDSVIGLVGLTGVAGAVMATVVGRLADRGQVPLVTAVGVGVLLLGWVPLWLGQYSLWVFIGGFMLTQVAQQCVHISNQNVIFGLAPEARSRINACYMTGYFTGAALGSALGAWAWSRAGWLGACSAGVTMVLGGVCVWAWDRRLARRG
jgi:predicted MFS family arabinose efflux permease